jgi:hypothetical protein
LDHRFVHQLDLCVLAYQVYNQSLIWPLDPWFEPWSRVGSSRRDNMLSAVHEFADKPSDYRGPGSTRPEWAKNPSLDPIISDYAQVRPWLPCVSYDGSVYRYFSTPASIRERIREVFVCEYIDAPNPERSHYGTPTMTHHLMNLQAASGASDRLYTFEGATGSIDSHPPAWGLLGTVLERDIGNGDYEIHIVYRGSQSGRAFRAAYQGFVLEAGNPDWVTDMEILKTTPDSKFSTRGRVVRGVRDSVVTSFGTITQCLVDIRAGRDRPPTRINVSGHSLGGALAIQFAAAVTIGTFRTTLPPELQDWPWSELDLITFSAPKAGDGDFAEYLTDKISATRIWVDGDPVTEFPLNAHVGDPVELRSGFTGAAAHETAVIRESLIRKEWANFPASDITAALAIQPWQKFRTLAEALMAAERDGHQPRNLFASNFESAAENFVQLAGSVIELRSSYRLPFTKAKSELRRRRRRLQRSFEKQTESIPELSKTLRVIRGVQPRSSVEDHLRRVLIVREAIRNSWKASDLLQDRVIARALGSTPWVRQAASATHLSRDDSPVLGPSPDKDDVMKIKLLVWMRRKHYKTVNQGSVKNFRRRYVPTSGMPHLVSACSKYPEVRWAPQALTVAATLPPEAHLPKSYVLRYYGLGKLGWKLYSRWPVHPNVPWNPAYEWNRAFEHPKDGWENPTSDDTFAQLRLQGPNPWLLTQVSPGTYELDFSSIFEGVLPPIVARFALDGSQLVPASIKVGDYEHRPGDATWETAKRVVNAADARYVPFAVHLLNVHFIVGQSFALAAYALPTWHPLRPFMQFFTYGTLQVNSFAYQALVTPSSYFISSGFLNVEDARKVFDNGIKQFNLDSWIAPTDIAKRGIAEILDHPYVADANLVWPAFKKVVSTHLDELGLDDDAIAKDNDLQAWYFTLAKILPNTEPLDQPLDRQRLEDLCSALLWNNVVHEVCGDLSPILGSQDPADKAIINLDDLRNSIGDGSLTGALPTPMMADVFLIDQASFVSRFNVGGNKILDINAAKWVDDPRLRDAIIDLQNTLTTLDARLEVTNQNRKVRFARMLPRNFEASISF